jgi:hypothetical protein
VAQSPSLSNHIPPRAVRVAPTSICKSSPEGHQRIREDACGTPRMRLRQPVADDLIEGIGTGAGERVGSSGLAVVAQRCGGIPSGLGIVSG